MAKNEPSPIAKSILDAARDGGMTTAKIAQIADVHEVSVRRWYCGDTNPEVRHLDKIAKAAKLTVAIATPNGNGKPEYSSMRVAGTAAKVLRSRRAGKAAKSLAGSVLTQRPNRSKRKPARRKR